MLNVLRVFKRDVMRLLRAPAALVVVLALAILPSIYTWYNVLGFWNPYEDTGNLKVCVVNLDQGGSSEITGKLDVGEQITQELRKNHQLDWQFTSLDESMDMLNAGRAYAVFVIPADFTQQLLTLTTDAFERPLIQYYVNEKAGPVSPKITDAGSTTLDETINSTFVSTVSDAVVKAVDNAVNEWDASAERLKSTAAQKMADAKQSVADGRAALETVAADANAAHGEVPAAQAALAQAQAGIANASRALSDISQLSRDMQGSLTELIAQATPNVSRAVLSVSQASAKANEAVGAAAGDIASAQSAVDASIQQARIVLTQSQQLATTLHATADAMDSSNPAKASLTQAADTLDSRNQDLAQNLSSLEAVSSSIATSASSAAQASDAFNAAAQEAAEAAQGSWDTVATELLPQANALLGNVASTATSLSSAVTGLTGVADEAKLLLAQLDDALTNAADAATQTNGLLEELEAELDSVYVDITALDASASLAKYFGLDDLDAEKIANFMGSPTEVVTEELYPLNAYGSAMAPLFMNLTFWIGAFMLLVVMRQEVERKGIPGLTVAQAYLGRFLLLALIACVQAVVCCTGVLALGVQAVNALALFAAAVVASLAYLSIIYALAITLQHIGKGICIVLVFVQIPGATGLYPIEMTAEFFRAIYPAFPFTYGISAMRESICGFYGTTYGTDLLALATFFTAFMALGLLVRPYMANVNRMVASQIRVSGLFNGERVEVPARRYRISQILRALADRQEYRDAITRRADQFAKLYPKLVRAIAIVGIVVPVAISVVFALTPSEKMWVLTFWLLWLLAVILALVIVEGLRYSIAHQARLDSMSEEGLFDLFASRGQLSDDGDGNGGDHA